MTTGMNNRSENNLSSRERQPRDWFFYLLDLSFWDQHSGWCLSLFGVTAFFWLKYLWPLGSVAMVYWVYGKAGYDGGVRVGSKGRALWFTNGEPVPDFVQSACLVGTLLVALFVFVLLQISSRWVYDRFLSKSGRRAD